MENGLKVVYERYQRQLPILGEEGQKKVSSSSVLIVGVGGLGSIVSLYLAAAGVGKLVLVDNQRIEVSNLNRQILYRERDVGEKKVLVAAARLRELNPALKVIPIDTKIDRSNVDEIVQMADVVVDALDNWETRLIVNESCVRHGKPFIHAGVEAFYGQVSTIIPGKTACLQCIISKPPPPRNHIPVIGAAVGVIGSIEALEVIKLLAFGEEHTLAGKLLIVDLKNYSLDVIRVERRPDCPVCSSVG